MVCEECSSWKCEELTYEELRSLWHDSIGGSVTPGILQRYKKKSSRLGLDITQIRIGFKYCAAGILTRFYVRKNEKDFKPMRKGEGCPKYSEGNIKMQHRSTLFKICATETHGPSKVKGIQFTQGLYENDMYMRVPMYGSVRPIVETGESECSACGQPTRRFIKVRVEKSFCCNEHYLDWWAMRYREELKRLDG